MCLAISTCRHERAGDGPAGKSRWPHSQVIFLSGIQNLIISIKSAGAVNILKTEGYEKVLKACKAVQESRSGEAEPFERKPAGIPA